VSIGSEGRRAAEVLDCRIVNFVRSSEAARELHGGELMGRNGRLSKDTECPTCHGLLDNRAAAFAVDGPAAKSRNVASRSLRVTV